MLQLLLPHPPVSIKVKQKDFKIVLEFMVRGTRLMVRKETNTCKHLKMC